ncbi:MAG: phosphotransferase family protein [Acidimicrobiales bacterium]|nr:phosphotransferase family protein [Acidimicrobiales bacterium]
MPRGIDPGPVTAWFVEHVPGVVPPLAFELIAGGHSNLTYKVTDAEGGRYVLRRPPLGHVLATAHDMGREHRIIAAVGPTAVPVAPALGLCADESVNGAPFYVMAYVDGHVLDTPEAARRVFPDEARRRVAGESLVDVLATLHGVDPDAVGLGDLGRKEGYVARQLKRWSTQWERSKTRELPAIEEVYERLAARIPEQGPAAIVHGDYRLGNCLVGDDGRVAAVLDWELCTLGDPLADVGYLLVYWTDPGGPEPPRQGDPSAAGGFPSRAELLDRYARATGRDLSGIDYYVAFSSWRLAVISEGVYARYVKGAMGDHEVDVSPFAEGVVRLAESALDAVHRLPG